MLKRVVHTDLGCISRLLRLLRYRRGAGRERIIAESAVGERTDRKSAPLRHARARTITHTS